MPPKRAVAKARKVKEEAEGTSDERNEKIQALKDDIKNLSGLATRVPVVNIDEFCAKYMEKLSQHTEVFIHQLTQEQRGMKILFLDPPGDVNTEPGSKIVFNAPNDIRRTVPIRITNSGERRIAWSIKSTNVNRLGVDPPCGVLDPEENMLIAVMCDSFAYGQEDTNNDRIVIEWTNTPDDADKQFSREWFQGDGMVRHKNLPIEYNP
ncbi:hypothetical protein QR680_017804 [Steinernema hermaphroditum]|uniref:Major sperm protein n=1 Tax=Steinernema hermaphroditum TaxID=289476 RepID=A0AA39HHY9_9BILA|nr:hypothetical protein QR680_017804 [Steinernema hermaphroditum]